MRVLMVIDLSPTILRDERNGDVDSTTGRSPSLGTINSPRHHNSNHKMVLRAILRDGQFVVSSSDSGEAVTQG